jgi:hypothetical protein
MMDDAKEVTYYPLVERWTKKRFACFKTITNKGLKYGRIDVLGFRGVGGDLSGEIETIAIEVKLGGSTPFALASGQTLGYRVFANRVYLALVRSEPFSTDEFQIASNLGIGLIQVTGKAIKEELSSPYYRPLTKLNLQLLESVGLGHCQFCGCVFGIGDAAKNRFARLTRQRLAKAVAEGRGMMFWNSEVSARKNRFHARREGDIEYERRFICRDCLQIFFGDLFGE